MDTTIKLSKCQLRQKLFLWQNQNLTHPFHLLFGFHRSRIFRICNAHHFQIPFNNSKLFPRAKNEQDLRILLQFIFPHFISFEFISSHFVSFFLLSLSSGGISKLSPGFEYFISSFSVSSTFGHFCCMIRS